jgi:biopolymer transport protein ExbD
MNLQPGSEDEPEINLTPLIDVVFLLLIFFMVSTTFEHQSRIKIELPEATAEPTEQEEEPLEIIIDAQGLYFIGDEQVVNTRLKTAAPGRGYCAGCDQPARPDTYLTGDIEGRGRIAGISR